MAKPTLNQFTDLRERFKQKREAKKPFEARGSLANKGRKKEPKPAKCREMYDANGFINPDFVENWLAPKAKNQ